MIPLIFAAAGTLAGIGGAMFAAEKHQNQELDQVWNRMRLENLDEELTFMKLTLARLQARSGANARYSIEATDAIINRILGNT